MNGPGDNTRVVTAQHNPILPCPALACPTSAPAPTLSTVQLLALKLIFCCSKCVQVGCCREGCMHSCTVSSTCLCDGLRESTCSIALLWHCVVIVHCNCTSAHRVAGTGWGRGWSDLASIFMPLLPGYMCPYLQCCRSSFNYGGIRYHKP